MNIKQAIMYFGSSRRLALAIGVDPSTVAKWTRENRIPPARQVQIEEFTAGKLAADEDAREAVEIQNRKKAQMVEAAENMLKDECKSLVCERCMSSPAFPVVWSIDGEQFTEILCENCDEAEIRMIKEDLR